MRKYLLLIFLFIAAHNAYSQQATIKGRLTDTLEKKPLSNAVVSLLSKKDSTLYKYDRSKDGSFQLSEIDTGRYILLITYPKFADYTDELTLASSQIDLGSLPMTQKSALLATVVIRNTSPIRIKGDTTEYIADSFALREGATVEDLLKKFPGFQVNSKGEITAQGQRVGKVLVDGEEFFGDDPTMATKNISAKAVDRVQVFDSKTEQQQLTGMTNGTEGKTVNIKLKEDKKKGAFGRAELGSGTENVTDAKLLYNRFIGKQKVSFYGTKSRTNTGSLNWNEQRSLGIENDFEFDEISGIGFSFNNDNEFENWSLRGLPDAYTAGGLFIDKWNADKHSVNTSYRYNRLGTTNNGSNLSQTILPDTLFYTNRFTKTQGLNQQHALNGKYEWKKDSLTSFKLTVVNTRKNTFSLNNTNSESLSEEQLPVNISNRVNSLESIKLQSNNSFTYKQLFKKKSRQLIATIRYNLIDSDQEGTLYFINRFFKAGNLIQSDTSDQFKDNNTRSSTFGSKITFNEPLNLKWNIVFDYGYNRNTSESERRTLDKANNGKYEILNRTFSNHFKLDAFSHNGSIISRYNTKKLRFSVGTGISALQLNLFNVDSNLQTRYNFLNVTPQAAFGYSPNQQSSFSVSYRGNTVQPSIEQLQPIRDNNDPLNLFEGNPDLKVGFSHSIFSYFHTYKTLAQKGFWWNGSFNMVQNAITNINTVDSFGKRTYKPINVNGQFNWNFWGELSLGEGEKKWIKTIHANGHGGRNINFINALKNTTNFLQIETGFGLRYDNPDKYNIYVAPELGYNNSVSSIRKDVANRFFTYGGRIEAGVTIAKKFELTTEADMNLRQQTDAFGNALNYTVWNATFSRKIFKKNTGRLLLIANDILNQNQGFNRVISSNFVSEDRYQKIAQYFMLKFEWSFNKMPGQN